MEKTTIKKIIPRYAIIPLLLCLSSNLLVYFGTNYFRINKNMYDYTSELDKKIPLVKWFIFIYVGCYIFWAVNYIIICRVSKKKCYELVIADLIGKIVCLVFYQLLPTTYCRPDVQITGVSTWLINYIYSVDSPTNLFPSMHCLVSWYCFAGIRNEKSISKLYKLFSLVFTILIFMSTVLVKQHILIDIPVGVFVAEVAWQVSNHTKISGIFLDNINMGNLKGNGS